MKSNRSFHTVRGHTTIDIDLTCSLPWISLMEEKKEILKLQGLSIFTFLENRNMKLLVLC